MKALASLCAVAIAAALAAPVVFAQRDSTVSANQTRKALRWKSVERFGREKVQRYAHLHRKWTKRSGKAVVGRQIAKFGMPKRGGGKRLATRAEWRRTMAVFDRWEHPPPPVAPAPTLQQTGAYTGGAYQGGSGSYSIPTYIVMCESGGDYNARNPSGAYGAYQIMPFHWSSGVCRGLGMDPAGQDQCAARIWQTSGSGAWACS